MLALGLAPVFTLAADLMVSTAPPERAGAAAGISETSSEFGGALGIAVLFTQALQLAASLSATVVIAAAVVAWALLRRVGGRSGARGAAAPGGRCALPGSHAVLAGPIEDRRGARRGWSLR